MIEVEGPDGTVIEFPQGTPPETIKAVMAKRYPSAPNKRVAELPDGSTLEIDVPEGADAATVERLGQEALQERGVRGRAVAGTTQPPGFVDRLADLGTNVAKGAAALPDMLARAGGAVSGAIGSGLGFLATGGGVSPQNAMPPQQRPAFSMRSAFDQMNPDAQEAPSAFAAEMLGSLVIPGGKAAPVRPTAPVANALAPAKAASSKLIPGAANVLAAGEREGVRVLRSDLKPPRTFLGKSFRATGEKIPVAGTGGMRAAQQEQRIEAVNRLAREFGADGEAVVDVAKDFAATRGKQLGDLTKTKDAIIEGTAGTVQTPLALKAISEQITKLQGINADAFAPVIAKLKSFEEVLQSGKSLSQIEGNRKLLGDLFADPTLAAIRGDGQKALNAIYGPLREDMGVFIEQQAGKGIRARWKGANDRLAAMAGELDESTFKGVLKRSETTPEDAAKLIFSKTPSQLRRLYRNLSPAGQTKAQAAIIYKAVEGATADKVVSPQKFANAMEAMEKATGVFFSPNDKARIEGLTRLLKETQRASEAAAMPATGIQNVPSAIGAGLGATFGWAAFPIAGSIGLIARAYESAPVRELLLRAGKAKPGSPGYKISLDRLNATLAKMAPAAAHDVDGLVASPTRVAAEEVEQD